MIYPCPIVIFDLPKQSFGRCPNKFKTICKRYFTFPVGDNINVSATNLNSDLSKINAWANQWKMTFNPDPSKHLDVYLEGKLNFCEHLRNMFRKINKTMRLFCKLQDNLPRAPLVTICKLFLRLHVDYRDILYDETF